MTKQSIFTNPDAFISSLQRRLYLEKKKRIQATLWAYVFAAAFGFSLMLHVITNI